MIKFYFCLFCKKIFQIKNNRSICELQQITKTCLYIRIEISTELSLIYFLLVLKNTLFLLFIGIKISKKKKLVKRDARKMKCSLNTICDIEEFTVTSPIGNLILKLCQHGLHSVSQTTAPEDLEKILKDDINRFVKIPTSSSNVFSLYLTIMYI